MPPRPNHTLKLRSAAEEAGWRAREAAYAMEEGVVWRGADAARELAERAGDSWLAHAINRVRWAIDRRIAWPLADALRDSGELTRTSITTAGVVLALAAGATGAMVAAGGEPSAERSIRAAAPAAIAQPLQAAPALEGVSPRFASNGNAAEARSVPAQPPPAQPAARTAWRFAQAFVLYEVGRAERAAGAFKQVTTPELAESLRKSPPRLPADVKVPRARVLNVVMGKAGGKGKADRAEASVSLVRLGSVSELRLGMRRIEGRWRVAEVLG